MLITNLKRLLKNKKGITFVELVVSTGLLGAMLIPVSMMIMNVIYMNTRAYLQTEVNSVRRIASERVREAVVKDTGTHPGMLPLYSSYNISNPEFYSYSVDAKNLALNSSTDFIGLVDYFNDAQSYRRYKYKVTKINDPIDGELYKIDMFRNKAGGEDLVDSVTINVK